MFVEELEGGAVFCEDFSDACGKDYFDIGEVSEYDSDWPESCVCFWGPCLVELFVCEFEDSWVDGFDADAESCDEFFGGELFECFDGGGGWLGFVVHG